MSLDFYLQAPRVVTVHSQNITHNLNTMAEAAGLYHVLWRPDEHGITHANQCIEPLRKGIAELVARKPEMLKLNPSNGWGDYDGLLAFAREALAACEDNPDAEVRVSR